MNSQYTINLIFFQIFSNFFHRFGSKPFFKIIMNSVISLDEDKSNYIQSIPFIVNEVIVNTRL
jgi:hypothetical protein